MARQIAAGELSATAVLAAHIARIEEVEPRLNALAIRLFDQARRDAAAVDAARQRGEALGLLAGVPITIKECYYVAETPATIGIPGFGQTAPQDGPLVARLRTAGAVIVGKTNLPQLMVLHETDNPVYGRTNNPWNVERSCGGSSGGEAALVAAGGSALGLGNDLGGSIRHPAHSCGICGLKPTSRRLTCAESVKNFRGMEAFSEQAGPLARCVDDLELALQVLAAPGLERFDPAVAPVPLSHSSTVRLPGLRIGFWEDDGYFPASPAIRRAVREAASALTAAGCEIVPFRPPAVDEAIDLYFRLISADGGADLRRLLGRGQQDWRIRRLLVLGRIPGWLRPAVASGMRWAGQRRMARVVGGVGPISADRYWQAVHALRTWIQRFWRAYYGERLSAVICPPHALPALTHGASSDLTGAASYCMLGNLLEWPAGVVPATRVRRGEESDRPRTWDQVDRRAIEVETHSVGLPVGVQVAAPPWREDLVLAVMRALEAHFRQQPDFPVALPV